ncbi:MAG: anhydro-N-acetylmuramic acid kinase [Pseudomonadota bacterium]
MGEGKAVTGKPIWVAGTMSGTSLDGVDAALVLTDGATVFETGQSRYRAYTPAEARAIRAVFGVWADTPAVRVAAEIVETVHADLLAGLLGAELIGFHGQTIAHDPRGRGTRQIGSGDVLAAVLGQPVVWDFRAADVAMGGEGAPLAPFYHFAALAQAGVGRHVAALNLGGVGNITLLDLSQPAPDAPGACLAFDTGPANGPLNDLVAARKGQAWDKDGALALAGTADPGVVSAFLTEPYFARIPPKSLDRDDFPDLLARLDHLSDADAAATLVAVVAACVTAGLTHAAQPPQRVFVTGGGRHNPAIMAALARALPCPVDPIDTAGLDGDMVEAQAFGYLAARVLRGLPTSAPGTTGVPAPVAGGQIAGETTALRRRLGGRGES